FAHFDFSVPGILRERMSLAGEDEQLTRNIQLVQSAIEQVVLEHGNSNIVRSGDDVGRGTNFIELVNRAFAAIPIGGFPGQPAKKISVVESGVIVAPVGNMLY